MNNDSRHQRLARLLNPRSIVFVGGRALAPAIAYCRRIGFGGDCFVVNPEHDSIAGIECLRSAAELENPADAAFVAVPATAAAAAVRDLATAGTGAAVVNSAGFSEFGASGAVLESELLAAAGEMPFLGPNCAGFANFLDRVGVMLGHMGDCDCQRGVAVISNGGAYLADLAGADRSLPIACIAGLGNQASVSIAELMEVLLDDERISAINLQIESFRDVPRLAACALKAHRKGIPVVALKAGKSAAGQRAALCHTASLAGEAEIATALFDRFGFVEVDSASEAMETLKMLTLTAAPRGPRLALATSSGTYAVMGADFAEKNGLEVPPATAATQAKLRPLMASFLVGGNPLDIATAQFWDDDRQRRIFDCLLADDYDVAVQCMSFPPTDTWEDDSWYRSARQFAAAARAADLPAAFVAPIHEGLPARAREMLIENGVAPLQGFEAGMRAIAHACSWFRRRRQLVPENMLLPQPPPLPAETRALDEAEAKDLLRDFGIPVPRGRRVAAGADIPAGLKYPAVLKVCDAAIAHKSEAGGISLNLANAELLRFAREQMGASLRAHGLEVTHYLIEESIVGGVAELMVGVRRIDGVGYGLTLAIGGIAVELLRDSATLLLPSDRDEIRRALERLRLYPILCGARGASPADVDSALDCIEAIADFVLSRSDIVDLEINPLILRAGDHGAVAADALLRIQPH